MSKYLRLMFLFTTSSTLTASFDNDDLFSLIHATGGSADFCGNWAKMSRFHLKFGCFLGQFASRQTPAMHLALASGFCGAQRQNGSYNRRGNASNH